MCKLLQYPSMFHRPGPVRRSIPVVILALVMTGVTTARGQGVTPQVQEKDIQSLSEEKPVKKWKPGDPVRVVPDLREDGEPTAGEDGTEDRPEQPAKPTVREPVAPDVMDRSIDELPTEPSYQEGDPVRVVPDLREDGSEENGCDK